MKKVVSSLIVLSLFSLMIFAYVPGVSANTEAEFDKYLENNIRLEYINEAGSKIEESGNRMRRATYLSWASGALYFTGLVFAQESPEMGSMMILGAGGISIWSWLEGFRAQADLRDGGEQLKESVRPRSSW